MRSVIVSTARTPFAKLGGGLASHQAPELGAIAIKAALERAGLEPNEVEYVIMGEVLQAGVGQAPARQAAIGAGIPKEVGADTINKVCASSIRAVEIANVHDPRGRPRRDRHRRHGVDVERAVPPHAGALRLPARRRNLDRLDGARRADFDLRRSGTWSSRPRSSAASSASRARSRTGGRSARTSAPSRRSTRDASPTRSSPSATSRWTRGRGGVPCSRLASLKPVFDPEGTTTAGNTPGVNDGAGAVVVTSEEFAEKKRGLSVLATIVSQGYVADDFAYLARTPAKAGAIALQKAAKTIDDVERVKLSNEAFSSVVLNSAKMLGAEEEKVNVNGGAVALGHPIGASGARIVGTLVHELRRNGGGLGLAAICSGGGQGDALLIEV